MKAVVLISITVKAFEHGVSSLSGGIECNYENETIYCQHGSCLDDSYEYPGCDCGAGYTGPDW